MTGSNTPFTSSEQDAVPSKALVDRFGRKVDYVRISVTDRCDFRCVYCMSEEMVFLPRQRVLSLEEIEQIAQAFVNLGVTKLRLTGGEPLIRRDIDTLMPKLGRLAGLNELVITTNGSQLTKMAGTLKESGVKRINISLDSLNAERFKAITRTGDLQKVLDGIDAAVAQGFERIKLNCVIMKGRNEDEVLDLVKFSRDKGIDISFIEEMPLGQIDHERIETYCSSDEVRSIIESEFELTSASDRTGGPSKYYRMADSDSLIGFISPHSHNFCSECNRVRVTVEGRLLLCLGNEHSVDLKAVLRRYPGEMDRLEQTIIDAMDLKPEKHEFNLEEEPQILRFMNMTGG